MAGFLTCTIQKPERTAGPMGGQRSPVGCSGPPRATVTTAYGSWFKSRFLLIRAANYRYEWHEVNARFSRLGEWTWPPIGSLGFIWAELSGYFSKGKIIDEKFSQHAHVDLTTFAAFARNKERASMIQKALALRTFPFKNMFAHINLTIQWWAVEFSVSPYLWEIGVFCAFGLLVIFFFFFFHLFK